MTDNNDSPNCVHIQSYKLISFIKNKSKLLWENISSQNTVTWTVIIC
jgi:hypothetical protein